MRKFPDQVDFSLVGYKGCVALHMAAKFDFDECAKELTKNGGTLCLPSTLGLTPLHVAAKYGSSNTMEVILRHGRNSFLAVYIQICAALLLQAKHLVWAGKPC